MLMLTVVKIRLCSSCYRSVRECFIAVFLRYHSYWHCHSLL